MAEEKMNGVSGNDGTGAGGEVRPAQFEQFGGDAGAGGMGSGIDLLMDVGLDVTIELGRTTMSIKEILSLGVGSVIELDKMVGDPVDILVNNKLIAKGEVVVVDENFGVRITSIVSAAERVGSIKENG